MEQIITELKPGDLVAFFYRTWDEQFEFLIPYLKQGLELNQRCIYIADDIPVRLILQRLEAAGLDVAAAQKRGALEVLTKSDTYLRHGQFDPERMVADLGNEVRRTLDLGFSALRGTGDMGWSLDSESSLIQMIDYQRRLYEIFPTHFLAVCQYNVSRFPAWVINEVALLHNVEIHQGQVTRRPMDDSTFVSHASENVRFMLKVGMPPTQVLARLATVGELVAGGGAVSSILSLDESGLLRNAASPGLPPDYLRAIDRLKPDPNLGTCAAAAATGQIVVTRDFFADEKWKELRHLPRELGFVGAWSMPIKDPSGKVLGTFGTYYREARDPTDKEKQAVGILAEAAALVLQEQ
jgi:hypothetical protein